MADNYMTDEAIFEKLSTLMDGLDRDQELQDLAERNGLDVKNAYRLSPTAKDNIAVSEVALLLAKRSDDPKYRTLVRTGIQKRSLKAEIINAYKDQAQALIQKFRNNNNV